MAPAPPVLYRVGAVVDTQVGCVLRLTAAKLESACVCIARVCRQQTRYMWVTFMCTYGSVNLADGRLITALQGCMHIL